MKHFASLLFAATFLAKSAIAGENAMRSAESCINHLTNNNMPYAQTIARGILKSPAAFPSELVELQGQCVQGALDRSLTEHREKLEEERQNKLAKERVAEEQRILLAETEREKERARLALIRKVYDSCSELARTRPLEAYTNKMCVDLFLELGDPEE